MNVPAGSARVRLRHLEVRDLRGFASAVLEPDLEGATVIVGPNGSGKTTFLEAVAFLGIQRSFRTTDREAMVRVGTDRAILRADLSRDGSPVLVEAEVPTTGRARMQVNRQGVRDRRHLAAAVPVTVFSPEDLAVVRGGPANRRQVLDDALRLLDRSAAAALDELDRVLRQRAALLRQAAGRLGSEVARTLDVWDARLAAAGTTVAAAREDLVEALAPAVDDAVSSLAAASARAGSAPAPPVRTTLCYRRSWEGELALALAAGRLDDVRRGVTGIGPHRDDLRFGLDGRDARTRASQGEQRTVALALRLAVHQLVVERTGTPPILLLDDVFSELDQDRSRALVGRLPAGQALITSAVPLPDDVPVAAVVDVRTLGRR